MDIFETLSDIPHTTKGQVVAIGNFDGVHLGHRALLNAAKGIANSQNKKLGVLTFEPPFRITPITIKHRLLKDAGVDFVVSLNFNWDFASQSCDDFVQHILKNSLDCAHVVIGEDFRFGQLRKGSSQTILDAGINVTAFAPVGDNAQAKYSSSDIRNVISSGDIESANAVLGWNWEMEGVIFRGDRRGHELGYPTANVLMNDTIHPAYGIYATWVQIEGEDEWRMAATNIGIRPMFEVKAGQIEAHILNFEDRDIYGQKLRVRPVKRLRGEAKFASLSDLIVQMAKDCEQAKTILNVAKL
jgi:riboflavin kinase / FMN adenylyltransferase